jgi:hypothetical protein
LLYIVIDYFHISLALLYDLLYYVMLVAVTVTGLLW